jgi:hypothetical protein
MIDWSDPDARFALIQRVGVNEYNRLMQEHQARLVEEHQARSAVSIVNGYAIKQVQTRLGHVFSVVGTDHPFATLDHAQTYARSLPPGTTQ